MLKIPELTRLSRWISGKGRQSREEKIELLNLIEAEITRQLEVRKRVGNSRPMTTNP